MSDGLGPGNGVVIEWFELFGGFTDPAIVPEMERDRLDYASQPGFIRKLLVVAAPLGEAELAGGIYFLRDVASARTFLHWATKEHVDPDGNLFGDREYVGEGHGYVAELIGHRGFAVADTLPAAVRVQRFTLNGTTREQLADGWAALSEQAADGKMISVSLAYDAETDSAFLISVSSTRSSGSEPDRKVLDQLAALDAASPVIAKTGAVAAEDILFWVFTIWDGYPAAESAPPASWPNSPPLPHPAYWKG